MRFSLVSAVVLALAADAVVANSWFGKSSYSKWHDTELERWLADHDVPYTKNTPADRKELEALVNKNWNSKVGSPYADWDVNRLQEYLTSKGYEVKKGTEKSKDSLVNQVKSSWYETEEQASDSYSSVVNWIFNTWSESQLKAFLDRHGIPNPQPRTRDSLLKSARESYQSVAEKAGEKTSYPGDWIYESWSESDLKAWLDEHHVPAPKGSKRGALVAAVRRNSRHAGNVASNAARSATNSAASATQSISDAVFESWSDSQIKEWADEVGLKVPQGSKRNELLALARKHNSKYPGASAVSSGSSAYHAATSSVGSAYAKATDETAATATGIYHQAKSYVDWAMQRIGLAASTVSASVSSATGAASNSASSAYNKVSASASSASSRAAASASSASSKASASASSASSRASASASSASSSAGKDGAKIGHSVAEAASRAKHAASEKAQTLSNRAKEL